MIFLIPNTFILTRAIEDSDSQFLNFDSFDNISRAPGNAKWTIMVYMAGDNNLEYFGVQDLNEMEQVGSSEDINIIVQFDRHPDSNVNSGYTNSNGDWTDTRRFLVQKDFDNVEFFNYTENENMWRLGELNMAEPSTLENFLDWGLGNYPAEHYLFVFWDHGEGIFSTGRGGRDSSGNGDGTLEKTQTRGICNDESDGGWLDLWDIRSAFLNIFSKYDVTIDIISFDICWIGTIETAYELMPFADYFTASPEEEPNPGWNYAKPLSILAQNIDIEPRQLVKNITMEFKEEYKAESYTEWRYMTYTAVDLQRFKDNFIPLLNNFAKTMSKTIVDNYNVINNARSNSMYPHRKGYMRDLFGFSSLIEQDKSATLELRKAAEKLNDEYNRTILEYVHGSLQPKGMGPTIYFPQSDYRGEYNSKLSFSKENWDDFINLYLTPIQIEHEQLNDTEAEEESFIELKAIVKGSSLDEGNIYLFYIDNRSDTQIPVKMEESDSGVEHEFIGKIKIQNYDSTVYYNIRAQETGITTKYIWSPQGFIADNKSTWYSFQVGKDRTPPTIHHDPVSDITGTLGEPYTFFVNISDNLGLDQDQLLFNYNTNNTNFYQQEHLELVKYPNRYQLTLPSQPKGTIIYYFFTAVDNAKERNSMRLPEVGTFEFNASRLKPVASFNVSKLLASTFEPIEFISTSKPEELITTYIWDFGDGTTQVKGKSVVHQFSVSKTYTVILKVFDENGLWSTASNRIIIKNSPPIAELKTDPIYVNSLPRQLDEDFYINGTIYENDVILLDCSGSVDKDGYIYTWSWQFGDGNKYTELWTDWNGDGRFDIKDDKVIVQTEIAPSELKLRLNSTKNGILKYNYKTAGDYKIRFSVTDNEGLVSEVHYFNVFVENKKPEPDPGYIKKRGLTVEFTPNKDGKNTIDTPSDMDTLNYTWDFGDGEISFKQYPNHTFSGDGKYLITLTVRDNNDATTTKVFELDLKSTENGSWILTELTSWVLIFIIVFVIIIILLLTISRKRALERNSYTTVTNFNKYEKRVEHLKQTPANPKPILTQIESRDMIRERARTTPTKRTTIPKVTKDPTVPTKLRPVTQITSDNRLPTRSQTRQTRPNMNNDRDLKVKDFMSTIKRK